jgi:hypothetical protein
MPGALFVHLSDIHLHGDSLPALFDLDTEVRSRWTGQLVRDSDHVQKGIEEIGHLRKILRDPSVSVTDKEIAARLYVDLRKALGGK